MCPLLLVVALCDHNRRYRQTDGRTDGRDARSIPYRSVGHVAGCGTRTRAYSRRVSWSNCVSRHSLASSATTRTPYVMYHVTSSSSCRRCPRARCRATTYRQSISKYGRSAAKVCVYTPAGRVHALLSRVNLHQALNCSFCSRLVCSW